MLLLCWVYGVCFLGCVGEGLGGCEGDGEFCDVPGDCLRDFRAYEGEYGLPFAVGVWAIWVIAVFGRLRSTLIGYRVRSPRLMLEMPGYRGYASVDLRSFGWILWVVIMICLGLGHPAEASPASGTPPLLDFEGDDGQCRALAVRPSGSVQEGVAPVNEWFGVLWIFAGVVAIISIWEALKFVCRCRRRYKAASCQTEGTNFVPLPLEGGVPNQARILSCLWQASYVIDIQCYPSSIQEEYFSLIGESMRKQFLDEEGSD